MFKMVSLIVHAVNMNHIIDLVKNLQTGLKEHIMEIFRL